MLSIYLLIPLSLMLFVVAIWAVRYAVRSNQFEDLDNASQRIILDDRQERRQTIHSHEQSRLDQSSDSGANNDELDGSNLHENETTIINNKDSHNSKI